MVADKITGSTKEQILAGEIYNKYYKYNRTKRDLSIIDILGIFQKVKDADLGKVINALEAIERNDVLVVEIITASPLSEKEQATLLGKLSDYYSKMIIPKFSLDAGIIGGILIKAGDNVLDSTVATRLRQL